MENIKEELKRLKIKLEFHTKRKQIGMIQSCEDRINILEKKIDDSVFNNIEINIEMKKKLIDIPKDVFKRLEEQAKQNDRSVNKEIISIIKTALNKK